MITFSYLIEQMALTLKDWLDYVYPILAQHWATRAIWSKHFLHVANHALNVIYNYQWYIRSWQHVKDVFISHSDSKHKWRLATRRPVERVDRFYTSTRSDVEWKIDVCECPEIPDDITCYSKCWCDPTCTAINMNRRLPQNELCAWEYKVSWSDQLWMWWLNWSIISAYVQSPTEVLRVSYYKWLKLLKSFDEVLPIPDSFLTAWAYFIAWIIVPSYWVMMQQQELNFMSMWRKELDSLRMHDNNFPDKVEFDKKYPVVEKQVSYSWFSYWQ